MLPLSLRVIAAAAVLAAGPTPQTAPQGGDLRALSASIEALSNRVAPSVVQVMVAGYAPLDGASEPGVFVGPQRAVGSGAILSADGYIITNAHVVNGAERVRVVLHRGSDDGLGTFLSGLGGETVDARVVGTAPETDLALLKVDATGLQPIALADYRKIRQGELVFAFGSPEGLANSMTLGVVSAVARQPDPDNPTLYLQTDAPINPGNSGGPLVNAAGELVGVNTFILSQSGGSQGLGFAIPSAVVATTYPDLQKYGRLRRGILGIDVQANSPDFAAGLSLRQSSGVLVSDVLPGGPAAAVGVQIGDLVLAVGRDRTPTVAQFGLAMTSYKPGDRVTLELRRDDRTLSVSLIAIEEPGSEDRLTTRANPSTQTIARLGVIGLDVTDDISGLIPKLREASGVFVAAREARTQGTDNPLTSGDVIHRVNAFTVRSVDGLRVILDGFKAGSRVVVQVEREGRLRFVIARVDR